MFVAIKVILLSLLAAWAVNKYGASLGLSDQQVQQVNNTINTATATVVTPEQRAHAEAAIAQYAPDAAAVQSTLDGLTPVIINGIEQSKVSIGQAAAQFGADMRAQQQKK